MIDGEVVEKYNKLLKTVNSVRDFTSLLPENMLHDSLLLNFILYFVEPTFESLDGLTAMNGIKLSSDERDAIYPHIIDFIVFIKSKFLAN